MPDTPSVSNSAQISKQVTQTRVSYSGPLPPANEFQKYNEVLNGAADRLLTMAENQAKHRQDLEKAVIYGNQKKSFLGLVFGFVVGIIGLASGAILIYFGKTTQGLIFGGGTLTALVSVFIYGSNQMRQERKEREISIKKD